ncbi:MAG: methionine adenosyltransferase [Euryarchaeota archaeon]|nr:methionine adenosyltransferase [Euryarchaeota archaeon]
MTKNINVEQIVQPPVERQKIELVERKGIGHPDSLTDGIAESISRALCQEYTKRVGVVLHHNTDETQIVAGRSVPAFGGGEIIQPIYVLLSGRATRIFNEVEIPIDVVAIKTAREYLDKALPNLDVNNHIILDCKIGTGSSDLQDVFHRTAPCANDTSFGVGYAPFSETEMIVYNTERFLMDLRKKIPAIGEDIKVMAMRGGDEINLTVACAMVGRYLNDLDHYVETKKEIVREIEANASLHTTRKIDVQMNVADDPETGSVYLTVSGTSAEMGDDGSVGRGNRANGLITVNRPMSMEATSGKNPIRHVGKLYNLLSTQIANQIVEEVEGIEEVYIRILSQIGVPIDDPHMLSIQTVLKDGANPARIESEAEAIANTWLDNILVIQEKLMKGEISTF